MSWLYSRVLVEEYLEANSLDGELYAPSSGTPTPQAYLSPDKMTAFSRLSRFGMTFRPLTDDLGAGLLTWFRGAFLAKTLVPQEKAPESTESEVECGGTWPASLARYDRDLRSWKTAQCSLLAGLDEFLETWPKWGLMRAGECWEQTMPAHLINENESGSSHEMWPTPRCQMTRPAKIRTDVEKGHKGNLEEIVALRRYPTPTAHIPKEVCALFEQFRNAPSLACKARGGDETLPKTLNPDWVEWLMGWPLKWTDLKPLETDKFQQWRHSHGEF